MFSDATAKKRQRQEKSRPTNKFEMEFDQLDSCILVTRGLINIYLEKII